MQRPSRLHADRPPDFFFSPSISLDLDRILLLSPVHRTHTRTRILATGADSRGMRDEAVTTTTIAATAAAAPPPPSPPPLPPPPPLRRFDCCWPSTNARIDAHVSVRMYAYAVCMRWVHAMCLCVIGCVAIVNEIVRSYAGETRVVFIG